MTFVRILPVLRRIKIQTEATVANILPDTYHSYLVDTLSFCFISIVIQERRCLLKLHCFNFP